MEVLSVMSSQLTIPKMIETFCSKESMGLFYIRLSVKAMLVSITLGMLHFTVKFSFCFRTTTSILITMMIIIMLITIIIKSSST